MVLGSRSLLVVSVVRVARRLGRFRLLLLLCGFSFQIFGAIVLYGLPVVSYVDQQASGIVWFVGCVGSQWIYQGYWGWCGIIFLLCVENLLCTSMSFRLLCLEYERNGWRGKSCKRVGSLSYTSVLVGCERVEGGRCYRVLRMGCGHRQWLVVAYVGVIGFVFLKWLC